MRDDVHVRAADRTQHPGCQLIARLTPPHVERGDDQVEPGEQVVVVVEPAVGPDLQLAAVQQAEAARRRAFRDAPLPLLRREPGVERGDDRALLIHPIGRQTVRDLE